MKNKSTLFLASLLWLSCINNAEELSNEMALKSIGTPELPFMPTGQAPTSLRTLINDDFQHVLNTEINSNPKWKRLISQKKMAIGVVNMSDTAHVEYARLNGNVMMYAASLPKIGILLAAMDAIEKGELEDTPELRITMRQMICRSSNTAATELMDLLGFDKIEKVLKDPVYDLYDEDYGGGLWVGKRYASIGERHPDPLNGISHGATVTQVCRYYYLMAYGRLVNYDRSKQMLEYMDNPEINHKFVSKLKVLAPEAHLYRKSGTWKSFHADSVLVWGPNRRYILVALVEDNDGEKLLRDLVVVVDNLLKSRHN